MSRKASRKEVTILSAAAATGAGTAMNVEAYRHITLSVASASSANLTVKFQASIMDTAPTWGSAASPSNPWDYIMTFDMQNTDPVEGDTGVVLTGTDDCVNLHVNTDGLSWLNANVTAWVAGSVTVKGVAYFQ